MFSFSRLYLLYIALFACLFQMSCGSSRRAQRVELNTVTVTANKTAYDIYRASETRAWDIVHTTAELSFNYKEKTADGRVWINLPPYFYETDTLALDAKGMKIAKVAMANDTNRELSYTYAAERLLIKTGKYTRQDTLKLYIRYTAMPYAAPTGGSAAITDDRGLYFINTDYAVAGKPAQIWTQGETESNSHWLPTIDKPNERFTVELQLHVPDSFVSLSNGYLKSQTNQGNGIRKDVWVMDKPIQTYAVMFAIGKFEVIKDSWNGKEISYYVEPEYAPYARRMFRYTPEMTEFFSRILGVPYPWNKYSQIVVRDYVSGAMENTSASLFGEFMNQNLREAADRDYEDVVSHELFHQWFGDYVTAESWSNLTVNESFANYGEQLWRRYKYGTNNADELALNDLRIYLGQAVSNDIPLLRFHYESREDMFDRVSYQKGGAILNYLHELMGDEAFYRAMHIYLTRHALQPAEATQWRIAVEDATGQDWNWFFNQWYNKGGHPVLDIQYVYDDAAQKLNVTVTQKQKELYRLPMKTLVAYGYNNKVTEDWTLTAQKHTYSYPYKNGVKPVVVPDVKHWLVGEIKENKLPQHWLAQYGYTNDYISKFFALENIVKKTDDTAAHAIINLALNDSLSSLRETALEVLQLVKRDNLKEKWRRDVLYMAEHDANNKVRTEAINVLNAWKVTAAKPLLIESLKDSSYSVAGAALRALNEMSRDTAYALAKQYLDTKPKAALQVAIWQTIAEQGKSVDISVYEKVSTQVYGTHKIQFAAALSAYLQKVKDNATVERGLAIFRYLTQSEGIKGYRQAIGTYMFEVAAVYKEQVAESRKNEEKALAQQKLELVRKAANDMIKLENEEENRKQYKLYMDKLF